MSALHASSKCAGQYVCVGMVAYISHLPCHNLTQCRARKCSQLISTMPHRLHARRARTGKPKHTETETRSSRPSSGLRLNPKVHLFPTDCALYAWTVRIKKINRRWEAVPISLIFLVIQFSLFRRSTTSDKASRISVFMSS